MPQSTIPQSVIDRDHELEARATRSSEALAKYRWQQTLDPAGPQYPIGTYARGIARAAQTVRRHAKGYQLFMERQVGTPGVHLTIEDALRLSEVREEQRAMHEAIAEGSGRPVSQVARGDNRHRTRDTMVQAHLRAERRGTDPVDEARNIASEQVRATRARRRRRTEDQQRHSLRYIHIEGRLAQAQSRLTEALTEAEGVPFTDEEMELLRHSIATVRSILNLLDARMAGTPDIDWDAELTRLGGGS